MKTGHSLGVVSLAASPDGSTVASSALDSQIRVWDVARAGAAGAAPSEKEEKTPPRSSGEKDGGSPRRGKAAAAGADGAGGGGGEEAAATAEESTGVGVGVAVGRMCELDPRLESTS